MIARFAPVLAALVAIPSAATSPRAAVPPGFSDALVATVAKPTALAFIPNGRILVATQAGQLRMIRDGSLLATPALDLSDRICSDSERGLLGVAVDSLPARPFVYLYYTFRKHGGCERRTARVPVNRLSRFTLRGDVVDPASELVLLDNIPSFNGNHNGGDVQVGTDGLLYVTVGDGGCDYAGGGCFATNDAARDRHALLGKVLRITREGLVVAGNPWHGPNSVRCALIGVAEKGADCRETFAWGLRNPFRIAFDPDARGRFFINDVGDRDWEEIDLAEAGSDYGWNAREGRCRTGSRNDCPPPPAGTTDPVFAYPHGQGCFSITGGAFVPKGVWPPSWDGAYLFADLGCGIFRLDRNGDTYARNPFVSDLEGVVHLAFGPWRDRQALYYTTYANGGEVRRIVHDRADRPVVRSFTATRAARVGRPVVARLEVSGVGRAKAACSGRIGARLLPASRSLLRVVAGTVATCRWRVPARTAGQTIRGSVTVTVDGVGLRRSFARKIRA